MKKALPAGTSVWTETISGEPIMCSVLEYDEIDHEYLLDSPAHGYAIVRGANAVKAATEQPK